MTPDEFADVMDRVYRSFPHQQFDAEAFDVWAEVLAPFPQGDVVAAVRAAVRTERFISVASVLESVRALRADRWGRFVKELDHEPVPAVDPDDTAAFVGELRALRRLVVDGDWGVAEVAAYERGVGPTLTGAARDTRRSAGPGGRSEAQLRAQRAAVDALAAGVTRPVEA